MLSADTKNAQFFISYRWYRPAWPIPITGCQPTIKALFLVVWSQNKGNYRQEVDLILKFMRVLQTHGFTVRLQTIFFSLGEHWRVNMHVEAVHDSLQKMELMEQCKGSIHATCTFFFWWCGGACPNPLSIFVFRILICFFNVRKY
jgi:hypothetical protein